MPKRRYNRRVVKRKRQVRRRRRRNSAKKSWSGPRATSYATTKSKSKKHPKRKSTRRLYKTKKRIKRAGVYGKVATKKRKTAKRKTKRKTTKRKSPKRVAAGKKAARTRARKKAARRASAKKAARKRTRKTTKRRTKRRTTKKRKTGRKNPNRVRAMKRAWRKRKKGYRTVKRGRKKVRKLYRTKRRGLPYKKPRKWGGSFRRHRNQNKNWLMTIGLGGAGLYLVDLITGWTQKKAEEKGYASKLQVAGANIVPIAVPMAISFGLMKYGHKVIKDDNIRSTLSMAFGMAGILAAMNAFIVPKLPENVKSKINGMSGYVVTNGMRGYVRSGMRGYVKSLGMGYMPTSRMLSPGVMRGLPQASYGSNSGLQVERRSYDKYQWGGVLSKNVFED